MAHESSSMLNQTRALRHQTPPCWRPAPSRPPTTPNFIPSCLAHSSAGHQRCGSGGTQLPAGFACSSAHLADGRQRISQSLPLQAGGDGFDAADRAGRVTVAMDVERARATSLRFQDRIVDGAAELAESRVRRAVTPCGAPARCGVMPNFHGRVSYFNGRLATCDGRARGVPPVNRRAGRGCRRSGRGRSRSEAGQPRRCARRRAPPREAGRT